MAQIHHLPAIAATPSVVPVALVDRDLSRARELAARWRVPRVVADVAEVADAIDAAVVALPNHLHEPVASALLRRGVHVLVEKPMAPTAAACDAMIAAAAASGATLAVGLEFRFFPSTALVRELLAAGVVGELLGFDLRQGVIPRWPFASDFVLRKEAAGGGVLADFGVHVLDLLLCWLGDWREVTCRDDARGGLESDAELRLVMASGLAGTVEVSRTRNLRNTCRFTGTRGELEVGVWDPDPEVSLRLHGEGEMATAGALRLAGRARGTRTAGAAGAEGASSLDFAGAFRLQLADFVAAVRERRPPRVPGSEGRRAVALVEASYARREPLALPWDTPGELAAWREGER